MNSDKPKPATKTNLNESASFIVMKKQIEVQMTGHAQRGSNSSEIKQSGQKDRNVKTDNR